MSYKNKTLGAGYRAGLSPRPVIKRSDGTKVLAEPECPFKGRFQVIARYMWWEGFRLGQIAMHNRWRNVYVRQL